MLSLIRLINALSIGLASTSERTASVAKETSVFIHTNDNGGGTGVLIDPQTVLTAAHNFAQAKPKKSQLFLPAKKKTAKVESVEINPELDVAVLKLDRRISAPFAEINYETDISRPGILVLKSAFLLSSKPKHFGDIQASQLTSVLHKGRLIAAETTIPMQGSEEERLASLFHLKSKVTDSGAGIFAMHTGKILTLNCTGNEYSAASGPSIKQFRSFIKSLK